MAILDLQVGASADDCRKKWTGSAWSFDASNTSQNIGYYDSTAYKLGGGMRFQNVAIPQGATITTAYLTLRANNSFSNTAVNARIKGEDVDDAAAFSNLADFDGRARTTAEVDWNNVAAWANGSDYNSPEIKTVIQEIVGRAGWTPGNALVIFLDDFDDRSDHNNYTCRSAYSYDGSSTYVPKLHIEYTEANGKTSSDAGSGVEATPVYSAVLADVESGAGVEAFIARLLAAAESGYGAEASEIGGGGLLKHLFASELGEGADGLTAKIEIPNKGGGMRLWT
jgi:hypothetical protein